MCAELDSLPPKYRPLYAHLVKRREDGHSTWHTTFGAIEEVIGDTLPPSAWTSRIFWSNLRQSGRASTAWFLAGWDTFNVKMDACTLSFRIRP